MVAVCQTRHTATTQQKRNAMKKRNYTREILNQIENGARVAVNSLGPEGEVKYEPRSKSDPRPWTDGFFRYSGRYVHTVPACGKTMLNISTGRLVPCGKPFDHDKACGKGSR